ncbi:hypothetical protein, partial [Bacteroides fragilis]|uniref:hypothetical protein n=1 Tax=Bacteroides fragilis TaxID=817 RepID=UPI00210E3448
VERIIDLNSQRMIAKGNIPGIDEEYKNNICQYAKTTVVLHLLVLMSKLSQGQYVTFFMKMFIYMLLLMITRIRNLMLVRYVCLN